jgi:hypothetical protein
MIAGIINKLYPPRRRAFKSLDIGTCLTVKLRECLILVYRKLGCFTAQKPIWPIQYNLKMVKSAPGSMRMKKLF